MQYVTVHAKTNHKSAKYEVEIRSHTESTVSQESILKIWYRSQKPGLRYSTELHGIGATLEIRISDFCLRAVLSVNLIAALCQLVNTCFLDYCKQSRCD